jgi:hypothetical protein
MFMLYIHIQYSFIYTSIYIFSGSLLVATIVKPTVECRFFVAAMLFYTKQTSPNKVTCLLITEVYFRSAHLSAVYEYFPFMILD